ncbi:MAG: phosphoribosylformylglycinamidine synthase I [Planctomycetota bacterium]|nr:MAG: phosphoribosylformylglycinamidine synthase I [Planctomycetota bacterium]
MKPKVLILRTAGTNCDLETAFAFENVGAEAERHHINRLSEGSVKLDDYHILAIPGGFSYGDDVHAGKILAVEMMAGFAGQLSAFVDAGKLIIGICNGFQVLVKAGLLPGNGNGQSVTLTDNNSNKYEDRWVYLSCETDRCVFIKPGEVIEVPVAHAEGKFVTKDRETLENLEENGQVVFRYVMPDSSPANCSYPQNPNGSVDDVAGICDPTGRILGMMPHPERNIFSYHHPRWTRGEAKEEGDGVRIFRNAVQYVKENLL